MRLRLPCRNRVGLIHDVTSCLAEWEINIVSLEVGQGNVFLECPCMEQEENLKQALQRISGVQQVEAAALMPSKERAEQLDAILGSVQDGILTVDKECVLTQCNAAAARILQLPLTVAVGQPLDCGLADALFLLNALRTGRSFRNREAAAAGTSCIVSTLPLRSLQDGITGAVAVVRDIREVRELVHKITASRPVTFADIPFTSMAMARVVEQARLYARSDSTILIRGETGTGKELFARALHGASSRAQGAFVPINCAAIPETLLESELFGYEEGAFTGAAKGGKPGLFERAAEGTLFLDEIGEMSVHLQAKLLRVLQERLVRRVGGSREIVVNVRIVSATNRDLEKQVARGLFREDLYYRLNVIPLFLPSLRERQEDIRLLAEYFLQRFASQLKRQVEGFTPKALERLQYYDWPGNVRELENVVERAVNLVEGTSVEERHILMGGRPMATYTPAVNFETYQTLHERLAQFEKNILQETVRRFGSVLGLSHTAVSKKLRKYGLSQSWQAGEE
jgi:transcriptional regulator of aroF, aroG, tyrA and aromatic amino acid transport